MADGPFPEHYEPFETPIANPLAPEGRQQSGGARVQGRHGAVRHVGRVPVRGDHLPPDRALPLLDQARRVERGRCSRSSSSRSAKSWPRRRASSNGDLVKVRCNRGERQGEGGGDQAHPAARRATARRCTWSASRSTGASSGVAKTGYLANTLTPYVGDANSRRRSTRRSWSTSRRREEVNHGYCNPSISSRRSATTTPAPQVRAARPRSPS